MIKNLVTDEKIVFSHPDFDENIVYWSSIPELNSENVYSVLDSPQNKIRVVKSNFIRVKYNNQVEDLPFSRFCSESPYIFDYSGKLIENYIDLDSLGFSIFPETHEFISVINRFKMMDYLLIERCEELNPRLSQIMNYYQFFDSDVVYFCILKIHSFAANIFSYDFSKIPQEFRRRCINFYLKKELISFKYVYNYILSLPIQEINDCLQDYPSLIRIFKSGIAAPCLLTNIIKIFFPNELNEIISLLKIFFRGNSVKYYLVLIYRKYQDHLIGFNMYKETEHFDIFQFCCCDRSKRKMMKKCEKMWIETLYQENDFGSL